MLRAIRAVTGRRGRWRRRRVFPGPGHAHRPSWPARSCSSATGTGALRQPAWWRWRCRTGRSLWGVIRLAWFGRVAKAGGAAGRSSPLRGTAADQVPSGACRADVDLPADAVLVGDRAEGVAPELLGQRNPDRATVGEAVEDGPQPRLAGADDRQFHPGLFVEGGVAAVAALQGDVAAGEQRFDDLAPSTSLAVGSSSPRRVIVVCPPNLLVEGDGLLILGVFLLVSGCTEVG